MTVVPSAETGTTIIPEHVAIIMDGNGRWAAKRSLKRLRGHEQGAEAVREALKGCNELGIRYLTLFAFSSENWASFATSSRRKSRPFVMPGFG